MTLFGGKKDDPADPLARYRPGGAGVGTASPRKHRLRNILIGVACVAALAFAWGYNPPTDGVHAFSKASDYRPVRDAGCTNSGKGCHGAETSYADFHDYHPDTPCTTCHDYQGIGCIPCHKPRAAECVDCHNGSIRGVANVAKLTASFPKGHYRETTHTATGDDWDRLVRAAEGGEAAAACKDCHSRDLRKAHTGVPEADGTPYGRDLGCGECHNDTRSGGLDVVLADWKTRRCDACHAEDGSAPMHGAVASAVKGTSPLRCGSTGSGCHETTDLHALHPDSPKDCSGSGTAGETGCHQLGVESHEPTITACGGASDCHGGYRNDSLSHRNDDALHSPETRVPARDTSFFGTACGDCHRMEPDGTSLVEEHALPTSERTVRPSDVCRDCHNHASSSGAISDDWSDRDNAQVCSTCHGVGDLAEAHEGDVRARHTAAGKSRGCASTGIGCHPTSDLSQVGKPTPARNIHTTCLRCHDWRQRYPNLAYDPDAGMTCGEGGDCHSAPESYTATDSVHDGTGGIADGFDVDHHTAGAAQNEATWNDPAAGTSTKCGTCHSMVLGIEHLRPNVSMWDRPGNVCIACHDHSLASANVVKASWPKRVTSAACASCHGTAPIPVAHGAINASHQAVERDPDGTPHPGACTAAGCHPSADVRLVHKDAGCKIGPCHGTAGKPAAGGRMSCGGVDRAVSCHRGTSAADHKVSHDASRTGTVSGISYGPGANEGCFGCHFRDLASEHSTALVSGQGGGASSCGVCHAGASGAGAYAGLPAVRAAIANHDVRCVACHASGSGTDGPTAVASPHKRTSDVMPLPAGHVRTDPLDDWRSAFLSPTGGGHNSLPASAVGGGVQKDFPVTSYSSGGTTFTWSLMPNAGNNTWLREDVFGAAAISTTAGIQALRVGCDDCHVMPEGMAGPQGAAVKVLIDPAYSQSEYANPTPLASQFSATGTRRVVCFKCHTIAAGSVPGTTAPGGHRVHAAHDEHLNFPDYNPVRYGEKCIDCHVRIPHAWKHQRLLIRTIETTDGVVPDTEPYVQPGHDGLVGIVLRDYLAPMDMRSRHCINGGCHGRHSVTSHPMPSDVPTAALWP